MGDQQGADSAQRTQKTHMLPSLLDFALRTLTLVVCDVAQGAVDGGEVRFADIEEMRAHATH